MAAHKIFVLWILVIFVGNTSGKHASRSRFSGVSGNPALTTSRMSGSARSKLTSLGAQPRALVSRLIAAAQRRGDPIIARIESRPMLIVRTRSSVPPAAQRRLSGSPARANDLLELLGIQQSVRSVAPGPVHRPSGVTFLGSQGVVGQGLYGVQQPVQVLPQQVPVVQPGYPLYSSAPVAPSVGSEQAGALPGSSNLRVNGVNAKGEVIISGPGGSITIGSDLLNGISSSSGFPINTEFEEIEPEAMGGNPRADPNRMTLTEPGQGSIVIERSPQHTGGNTNSNPLGTIQVLSAGGSSSGSTASSSASSSSSSATAAAQSGSISASSSASSAAGEPLVAIGNGVSVEQGPSGQIIRLGKSGGQEQVISIGDSSQGEVQVAGGGSGIKAPANATFIVNG